MTDEPSVEDRIARLEARVEELERFHASMRRWAETWGPRVAKEYEISLDDAE